MLSAIKQAVTSTLRTDKLMKFSNYEIDNIFVINNVVTEAKGTCIRGRNTYSFMRFGGNTVKRAV